jgi:hypothetical protein
MSFSLMVGDLGRMRLLAFDRGAAGMGRVLSSSQRGSLEFVLSLKDLSGTLSDDHARGHRVADGDARHDGAICDTQPFDAVHFERTVNDRHRILAHLGGTRLMPVRNGCIADKVLEIFAA